MIYSNKGSVVTDDKFVTTEMAEEVKVTIAKTNKDKT